MIEFSKKTPDNKSIYYEILENGYKIYINNTIRPSIYQYEPYIPDPSKTYEENAIDTCEELSTVRVSAIDPIEERLINVESNIDYLMLLNDSIEE